MARNLSAIVLGEEHEALHLETEPIDASMAQNMAGLYRYGPDFYVPNSTIQITASDGYLFVPGQQSVLLRLSDQIFVHRAHWFRVIFDWYDDGQVTGMRYGQFKAKKESGN